jgi:hypothetical protein
MAKTSTTQNHPTTWPQPPLVKTSTTQTTQQHSHNPQSLIDLTNPVAIFVPNPQFSSIFLFSKKKKKKTSGDLIDRDCECLLQELHELSVSMDLHPICTEIHFDWVLAEAHQLKDLLNRQLSAPSVKFTATIEPWVEVGSWVWV